MEIVEATRRFEAWLRRRIVVIQKDLDYKHAQMRADPFLFFRATYYRWTQVWPEQCPKLSRGPEVFAVGDLHLENFGTWRDAEGRLVWGVNDFDEAHPMAFTNDLVRLAVSALLAAQTSIHFRVTPAEICGQLVEGYQSALEKGGEPFVLMEDHPELRKMALQGFATAGGVLETARGEVGSNEGEYSRFSAQGDGENTPRGIQRRNIGC